MPEKDQYKIRLPLTITELIDALAALNEIHSFHHPRMPLMVSYDHLANSLTLTPTLLRTTQDPPTMLLVGPVTIEHTDGPTGERVVEVVATEAPAEPEDVNAEYAAWRDRIVVVLGANRNGLTIDALAGKLGEEPDDAAEWLAVFLRQNIVRMVDDRWFVAHPFAAPDDPEERLP